MGDTRTYVRLHDGFPEHPKILEIGGDAAWLYVCGLCYCGRQLTDGRIPKAVVPRLSDRKNADKLARKLVIAGLWLDVGSEYEVNDYLKHQRSSDEVAELRQAKAGGGRKGNHIRHHLKRKVVDPRCEYCSQNPRITDPITDRSTDAKAIAGGSRTTDRKTSPEAETDTDPPPTPSARSTATSVEDDDDGSKPNEFGWRTGLSVRHGADAVIAEAVRILADQDLCRAEAQGQAIVARDRWRSRAEQNRMSRHDSDARELMTEHPDLTVGRLVLRLDHTADDPDDPDGSKASAEKLQRQFEERAEDDRKREQILRENNDPVTQAQRAKQRELRNRMLAGDELARAELRAMSDAS